MKVKPYRIAPTSNPRAYPTYSDDQPFGRGCLYNATAVGGVAWPSANRAIYQPLLIFEGEVYSKMEVSVGTISAGTPNIDMGIFNGKSFVKLASTGGFAATASSINTQALTADIFLPPGFYYIGIAVDATSININRATIAAVGLFYLEGALGERQEASAYPLPATMTPVFPASLYVPIFGVVRKGLIA